MKLVSFNQGGRSGFGVVSGDGVIDMRSRLPRYQSLLEVLRAGALDEVQAVDARIARIRPGLQAQGLVPPQRQARQQGLPARRAGAEGVELKADLFDEGGEAVLVLGHGVLAEPAGLEVTAGRPGERKIDESRDRSGQFLVDAVGIEPTTSPV